MGKGGCSTQSVQKQSPDSPAWETKDGGVKEQLEPLAVETPAWESPYKPLAKNAPKLPTKGELKSVIPKECFERSWRRSFSYLVRDLSMAAVVVYAASQLLSPEFPQGAEGTVAPGLQVALWYAGWSFYIFWMGTIMAGLWVIAHECGHGAFTPSQTCNDVVGFIIHQLLLVPYFAWQFTHAKHHRRTNHAMDGETHVPCTPKAWYLEPISEIYEAVGSEVGTLLLCTIYLTIGWPLYICGVISMGRLSHDGTPREPGLADHFRPSSSLFPPHMSNKIIISTTAEVLMLCALCYAKYVYGVLPVVLYYWGPYLVTNAWLVLYTYLHHTDASVPHYGSDEWTWMHGAVCSTIDRDYGIFDFFHHHIGSTHVVHHAFHELPHYHAVQATEAVKAFLEPQGLYNFDPTPWYKAFFKSMSKCYYIEDVHGVQYYRSVADAIRMRKKKV